MEVDLLFLCVIVAAWHTVSWTYGLKFLEIKHHLEENK